MKRIISVTCAILMLVLLSSTAFAESIDVLFNDIRVYIDGALTEFRDANGNPVEPFIYNGNVYLPLPAVADAMGVGYSWDGSTMSAYVGTQPGAVQYLLEVCPPYQDAAVNYYTSINGESFQMAGQKYTNGLAFRNSSVDQFALFNLNGQYKTLRFTLGHRDGENMKDTTIHIYLDGKVAGEYIVGAEDLPREYVLNLNHALTMKITGVDWIHYCGMADITIE